jgi:hypothetical protein
VPISGSITSSPVWVEVEPSSYLTDGRRLFRVVSGFTYPPEDSLAVLEDCSTLDISTHSADELWDMDLRVVRAPRGGPEAASSI